MKTLLRIDASAQLHGSHSRALADHYQQTWQRANPDGKVVARDLAAQPLPHLDGETIAIFYSGGETIHGPAPIGIKLSDELIAELKGANDVLVSSALYNFNIASSLKAWVDHVVRFGHTIRMGAKGPIGTMAGRSVCLITARGGTPISSPDFQEPSLRAVFAYMGFGQIDWVSLEGTKMPDQNLMSRLAEARTQIDGLFSTI